MFQFKAHREYISRVFSLFLLTFCAGVSLQANPSMPNPPAQLGWGFEVGRANEGDVEALLADQLAVKRSLAWISQVTSQGLGRERQLAMLVEADSENIAILMEKSKKYWDEEVDGPIRRIAKNRAASCAEAQGVVEKLLGMSRQRLLLGDDESYFGQLLSEVFSDAQNRCHEEALDECNATGNYEHIFKMALGEERKAQLLNSEADTRWVKNVLEECANYELHFVSDTDSTTEFHIRSVVDGRIPIKPIIEGEGVAAALASFRLEGEADKDPILQKLECSAEGASIRFQAGGKMVNPVWA